MTSNMGRGMKCTQMGRHTLVNTGTILSTVKDCLCLMINLTIRENSKMIKKMAKEFCGKSKIGTLETGRMIKEMGKVHKCLKMGFFIRENLLMTKLRDRESYRKMVGVTKVVFRTDYTVDMVN